MLTTVRRGMIRRQAADNRRLTAHFDRIARLQEETAARQAKTDEQMAKTDERLAETEKLVADLSKSIGGLQNTLGSLTEEAVAGQICENFQALGYKITKAGRNMLIKGADGRKLLEMDIFLENGDVAIPVEVKTKLTKEDVDDHLERIQLLRRCMDERGDARKLVGAVAGGLVAEGVRNYAQKKGLYVLVQSGESISLAESAPWFEPRVW